MQVASRTNAVGGNPGPMPGLTASLQYDTPSRMPVPMEQNTSRGGSMDTARLPTSKTWNNDPRGGGTQDSGVTSSSIQVKQTMPGSTPYSQYVVENTLLFKLVPTDDAAKNEQSVGVTPQGETIPIERIMGLSSANNFLAAQHAIMQKENFRFVNTVKSNPAFFKGGDGEVVESELDGYLFSGVLDKQTRHAFNSALDGRQKRLMRWMTAQSIRASMKYLGPSVTQPNKLRSADSMGSGNYSASAGHTLVVVGWEGVANALDVWGVKAEKVGAPHHGRRLFLILKRSCLIEDYQAGDAMSFKQDDWSAFQFVPYITPFGEQCVPDSEMQYLGLCGALEHGIPIFVGTLMLQHELKPFTQDDCALAAGIVTPQHPRAPSLESCMAANSRINLLKLNVSLRDQGFFVPIHA